LPRCSRPFPPRDYAYTGLIAAYSLAGDVRGALGVRGRMRMAGVSPSVHVFNALIAAAERAGLWERGLELGRELAAARVEPNAVTRQLLGAIGRGGAALVGDAHLAVTALTAAVAAAGSLAMRSGLF
jgi:pentatricopeptide repeat protein